MCVLPHWPKLISHLPCFGKFIFWYRNIFSSGLFAPFCGFCLLRVVMAEESENRHFWCQLLSVGRNTIARMYIDTLLFNLIFRVVLIRFAERGLVVQGRPNLDLFRHLYWTVFGAFFTFTIFGFPVSSIVQGTYDNRVMQKLWKYKQKKIASVRHSNIFFWQCHTCFEIQQNIKIKKNWQKGKFEEKALSIHIQMGWRETQDTCIMGG